MLRPEIAVMDVALPTVSAVMSSYITARAFPELPPLIAIVVASYFAIVGSYIFNDFCDVDIDRINLPERALPSGKLGRWEALLYALVLYAVSIVIFALASFLGLLTLIAAILVISSYSAFFKRRTPLSFIPVGVSYGLVPIGVWFAMSGSTDLAMAWPLALLGLMICVTDWGFTLSGVSRDVEGDRRRGAPTLPVTFGIPFTARLVLLTWVLGVGLSIAIWFAGPFGWLYLAAALLGGAWLISKCIGFVRRPYPDVGGRLFLQAAQYRGVLFLVLIIDMGLPISGVKVFAIPGWEWHY